jgi:hypothetical protein
MNFMALQKIRALRATGRVPQRRGVLDAQSTHA